ncbi:PREDICTED: uncharacterized protein LOC106816619 [Priapulus caudatus]|uniref:Uncharacterized protein LOC106816619 n=1 Tax=Priapulus caudatus TaxID=37621 RepID=A0ABM1EX07_PRICU|nr:PREDICTED: uncharacterized protein LOC106816619 [Priapulus caudatus]
MGLSGKRVEQTSPYIDMVRKDSLSLQVEFVKVNISRCRKTHEPASTNSSSVESGMSRSPPAAKTRAIVRFSAVCDIGSASFKYDMRRLTEILAFPKAWYRRNIARRMFLGDQSVEWGALDSSLAEPEGDLGPVSDGVADGSAALTLIRGSLHRRGGSDIPRTTDALTAMHDQQLLRRSYPGLPFIQGFLFIQGSRKAAHPHTSHSQYSPATPLPCPPGGGRGSHVDLALVAKAHN